jgi:1-phosphofructokinase family hexose kinase
MILAINANAAIDQVLFIDQFRSGGPMRSHRAGLSIGGKILDAAIGIKTLGGPVQVVSFIAGQNGKTLAGLLEEKGIPSDLVWVEGETRVAYVIVETDFKRHSHITTPGYTVTTRDCVTFLKRVQEHTCDAAWAVIGGTLPQGAAEDFYCQLIALLHQSGVKTLADCAGNAALSALAAAPDILKMNQAEFKSTFPEQSMNLQEYRQEAWVEACRAMMEQHAVQHFLLTCGKEGLLALLPGQAYHAAAPLQQEVNAAGSGDAVSGALAYHLALGKPWEEALRWAAAAGAAVVLTEGTAECSMEDVQRIYAQTQVTAF